MTALPFYLLKRHALAIEAHFDFVLVLTYAFPAHVLQPLVPPGLVLDTFGDLAFVALAIVRTGKMRPRGWPALLSRDYILVGYRIFVRYRTLAGKNLRGLKILRSDASRRSVVTAGNLMTHYNFKQAKIDFQINAETLMVQSRSLDKISDLSVSADLRRDDEILPVGSAFPTIKDALKFAGPMPFTFDYERESNSIIRVEGVRQNWHPRPVAVDVSQVDFFKQAPFDQVVPLLCSAFYVKDIPYYWKAGIVEQLTSNGGTDKSKIEAFDSRFFVAGAFEND